MGQLDRNRDAPKTPSSFSTWRKKKKAHIQLTIMFIMIITPLAIYRGLAAENLTLAWGAASVYIIGMLMIVLLG